MIVMSFVHNAILSLSHSHDNPSIYGYCIILIPHMLFASKSTQAMAVLAGTV